MSDVAHGRYPPRHYRDTLEWAPSNVRPQELNSPWPNLLSIMIGLAGKLLSDLRPMGPPMMGR